MEQREKDQDENMKKQDGAFGGRTGPEKNERDILIDGFIIGLGRILVLGKFQGIHKDDPR